MVARAAQMEDCVGRRQAAGEGERVLAALERGEAPLQGVAGRVARARVLETLVFARTLLHVGGGQVHGRHHRAGGRVGPLAGVDGEGLEAVGRAGAHGAV